jgi:hypothetical protein
MFPVKRSKCVFVFSVVLLLVFVCPYVPAAQGAELNIQEKALSALNSLANVNLEEYDSIAKPQQQDSFFDLTKANSRPDLIFYLGQF